jgi:putative cardiolipin synthase
LNLDPRALLHNTEIGVVFTSTEIPNEMGEWFDQHIEQVAFRLELQKNDNGTEQIRWHGIVDGEQRVFNVDPNTGYWKRLGVDLMSILPIESQL